MAYFGRELKGQSLPNHLDWSKAQVVLVTGALPNTCGHVLLYVGGGFGNYFHFDGNTLFEYPKYMEGDAEYRHYLRVNGKDELLRHRLDISNPMRAMEKLHELMNGKWASALVAHNCASFVMEIAKAGGDFWSFSPTCPILGMAGRMMIDGAFK